MAAAVAYGTLARVGLGAGALGMGLVGLAGGGIAGFSGYVAYNAYTQKAGKLDRRFLNTVTQYRTQMIALSILSLLAGLQICFSAGYLSYFLGKAAITALNPLVFSKTALLSLLTGILVEVAVWRKIIQLDNAANPARSSGPIVRSR